MIFFSKNNQHIKINKNSWNAIDLKIYYAFNLNYINFYHNI